MVIAVYPITSFAFLLWIVVSLPNSRTGFGEVLRGFMLSSMGSKTVEIWAWLYMQPCLLVVT